MFIHWTRLRERVVLMTFSFVLFLISSIGLYKIQVHDRQTLPNEKIKVLGVEEQSKRPGIPVRLIIPAINVDTAIQQVGVNSEGEMEVPNSILEAGWFKIGPIPGEIGSAVIAGHLDGKNDEAGVFVDLYKLKENSLIYVEDDKGESFVFIVREKRILNPDYAKEVFDLNDGVHLNLVTCDGVWDLNKKSYSKRLVVFADSVSM
ncbi:MAG: class F sortase [Microgenomates group bacterium]